MLTSIATLAAAADLPTLADRDGYAAAGAELDALVASARGRKLEKLLAAARLAEVGMPVRPFLGAELVVTGAGPASGCAWDGDLTCRVTLAAAARLEDGEYVFTCRSTLGARLPVASRLVSATDAEAVFEVSGMRACWSLGNELLVHPTAADDLEGVGEGTDLIPPELTGLTREQVEEKIVATLPVFKHCLASTGAVGLTGKLVVAYRIAEDGTVASAVAETSSIADAAVEGCVLERFRALSFPKPMGGWDHGTYPFTFQ